MSGGCKAEEAAMENESQGVERTGRQTLQQRCTFGHESRVPCSSTPEGKPPQKLVQRPSDAICHHSDQSEACLDGKPGRNLLWNKVTSSRCVTQADVTHTTRRWQLFFFLSAPHSVSSKGVFSHVENLKAENERKLANLIFGLLNKLYTLKRLALATTRHRIPRH